jgi:hypothetical protein
MDLAQGSTDIGRVKEHMVGDYGIERIVSVGNGLHISPVEVDVALALCSSVLPRRSCPPKDRLE